MPEEECVLCRLLRKARLLFSRSQDGRSQLLLQGRHLRLCLEGLHLQVLHLEPEVCLLPPLDAQLRLVVLLHQLQLPGVGGILMLQLASIDIILPHTASFICRLCQLTMPLQRATASRACL